jgi:hypothetical protein
MINGNLPVWSLPAPELPGEEITETEQALKKSQSQTKSKAKKPEPTIGKNWRTPPIEQQLARDKTLIGMGYGALFVPAYSESRLEPEVAVYKAKPKPVAVGQTGRRIQLEKGTYTVKIGSGSREQKMRYKVTIGEGHTTIIEPDWAGLIIQTINEFDDNIREEYEIYKLTTAAPYGKGYGLLEERIKDIKTWILPPGNYRISRVGEDFTSLTNYITVQLNPCELTEVELVFDEEEGQLIAGGLKTIRTGKKAGSNWQYGLRFGGNVNLFSTKEDSTVSLLENIGNFLLGEKQKEISLSTLADLKVRAKFDNVKYLGLNVIQSRSSFRKEKGHPFKGEDDELEFRSTWVRRLNDFIGPYIRGKMQTHLFPEIFYVDTNKISDPNFIFMLNEDGDTIRTLDRQTIEHDYNYDFVMRPSLLPFEFSEGIGLNLELLSLYSIELSTLIGAGAKQYINRDQYEYKDINQIIIPLEFSPVFGLENTINLRLKLGPIFTIDFRSDLFYPNLLPRRFEIDDLTMDIRMNVTKNFEVTYMYELVDSKEKDSGQIRFEHKNRVLLRISINI